MGLRFQLFKLSSKALFSINYVLQNNGDTFPHPYGRSLFYKSSSSLVSKPEPHLGGVFGGNVSGSTMLLFSGFPINRIKEIKKQESV